MHDVIKLHGIMTLASASFSFIIFIAEENCCEPKAGSALHHNNYNDFFCKFIEPVRINVGYTMKKC